MQVTANGTLLFLDPKEMGCLLLLPDFFVWFVIRCRVCAHPHVSQFLMRIGPLLHGHWEVDVLPPVDIGKCFTPLLLNARYWPFEMSPEEDVRKRDKQCIIYPPHKHLPLYKLRWLEPIQGNRQDIPTYTRNNPRSKRRANHPFRLRERPIQCAIPTGAPTQSCLRPPYGRRHAAIGWLLANQRQARQCLDTAVVP